MVPFDTLENIIKPKVFGYFQEDQKGILERKGLKEWLQNTEMHSDTEENKFLTC